MLKTKPKPRIVDWTMLKVFVVVVVLVIVSALAAHAVLAGARGGQTSLDHNQLPTAAGGDYELNWSTVDAGSSLAMQGGDYVLQGTAGQPDAGALASSGSFAVQGGFWFRDLLHRLQQLFLPLIQR